MGEKQKGDRNQAKAEKAHESDVEVLREKSNRKENDDRRGKENRRMTAGEVYGLKESGLSGHCWLMEFVPLSTVLTTWRILPSPVLHTQRNMVKYFSIGYVAVSHTPKDTTLLC